MTTVNRFDRVALKATRNDAGAIIDSPVLTRTGVFPYRQPDGSIRREYRPPEAVFHADSLKRYMGLPITDGHPGMVNGSNVRPHLIGTVTSEGRRQDVRDLAADLVVHATDTVDKQGNKELSVGYTVELVEQSGTTPEGEEYDAIQTRIVPNHLAVVKAGRAGNARLNLDSIDDDGEPAMEKLRLDNGLTYDVPPEVAVAFKARADELTLANAALSDLKARADKADKDLADEKAKADQIRADARARLELEALAKTHGVEVKQDQQDGAVRAAILAKLQPSVKLDGKSPEYVAAALDMAVAQAARADENADAQRKQAEQRLDGGKGDNIPSAAQARYNMIHGGPAK